MDEEIGFTPPPFRPGEALVGLRRTVRDWRSLTERGPGFEFKGQPVLTLEVQGGTLLARVVRRPARSPQWDAVPLASSLDVRRFTEDLKKRVAQWGERDD